MFSALKPVSVITPTWETQYLASGQTLCTEEKSVRESSASMQLQFQPIIMMLVFQLFSETRKMWHFWSKNTLTAWKPNSKRYSVR